MAVAVVVALWPGTLGAQSIPACQFASEVQGQTVTIAVLGSSGIQLRVDWGDGQLDSTARPTSAERGRAFLRHDYAAPGTYTVKASATTLQGRGCGMEDLFDVPAFTNVGGAAAEVLPSRDAPASSDQVADRELGQAMAEARVVEPPRGPSLLELLGRWIGSIFGR
jgi:hypothetical protein